MNTPRTLCRTRWIACLNMAFDGPPPSWYDPPEPRHLDGSIIGLECNCEECHAEHDLVDNYGSPDYQCCTDDVEQKVEEGVWCQDKPLEHRDDFMEDGKCLECAHEQGSRQAA